MPVAATDWSAADAGIPATSAAAPTPARSAVTQTFIRANPRRHGTSAPSDVGPRTRCLTDLVDVSHVRDIVRRPARPALEPGVEDLAQQGLTGAPQRQRQHV